MKNLENAQQEIFICGYNMACTHAHYYIRHSAVKLFCWNMNVVSLKGIIRVQNGVVIDIVFFVVF